MNPQPSSAREVAESIARRGIPYSWLNNEDEYKAALNWFANEIESALKERDRRAANIARGEDCGLRDCLCATIIAAAITKE